MQGRRRDTTGDGGGTGPGMQDGTAPEPTDEDVAHRAREGSQEAFETLVHRHEKRIFNFLLRRTESREDAEDLSQQTFVKAYVGLRRYDSSLPFAPWLYTIARRVAATHARACRRQRRPAEGFGEPAVDLVTPARILSEGEQAADLWAWARRRLSDDQFTALWLQIREDFSVAAIAAVMGRTRVSVKVLLHRGRRRLAAAWPPSERERGKAGT